MRGLLLAAFVFATLPVAVYRPWIGVLLYSWLTYMNPHRLTWGFAYSFPFAQVAAIATLLGLVVSDDRPRRPRGLVVSLLLALWAMFGISTWYALYPEVATQHFVQVSKILVLCLVTIAVCQEPNRARALIAVLALSIAFYGVKGGLFVIRTAAQHSVVGPPDSFFEENNTTGLAFLVVLPLLAFLRAQARRPWPRRALTLTLALTVLATLMTYSRGTLIGLVAVMAVWFAHSRRKAAIFAVLAIGLAAAATLVPYQWLTKMETIADYQNQRTAQTRFTTWGVAWQLALDHPLVGAGFRPFQPATFDRYAPKHPSAQNAHDIYLQVLAEHGFVGLALYLGLIGATFASLRRLTTRTPPLTSLAWVPDAARAIHVGLVGFLVAGAFLSDSYFEPFLGLVTITVVLESLGPRPPIRVPALTSPGWAVARWRPPMPARARTITTLPALGAARGSRREDVPCAGS